MVQAVSAASRSKTLPVPFRHASKAFSTVRLFEISTLLSSAIPDCPIPAIRSAVPQGKFGRSYAPHSCCLSTPFSIFNTQPDTRPSWNVAPAHTESFRDYATVPIPTFFQTHTSSHPDHEFHLQKCSRGNLTFAVVARFPGDLRENRAIERRICLPGTNRADRSIFARNCAHSLVVVETIRRSKCPRCSRVEIGFRLVPRPQLAPNYPGESISRTAPGPLVYCPPLRHGSN